MQVQRNAVLGEMVDQLLITVSVFDLVFARQKLRVDAEPSGQFGPQRFHELVQQSSASDQSLERVVIVQFGMDSGQMKFDLVTANGVSRQVALGQFSQSALCLRVHLPSILTLEIGSVILVGHLDIAEFGNVTLQRFVLHMQVLFEQRLLLIFGVQ